MTSEIANIKDAIAVKKANKSLQIMAEEWAKETNIDTLISKFTTDQRSKAKLKELVLMGYSEGLYNGFEAGKAFSNPTQSPAPEPNTDN